MSTQMESLDNVADALKTYASYPFASDETYQQGLASIISGPTWDANAPQETQEEIIRRTRVFYFNKIMGTTISMDEVREYQSSSRAPVGEPLPNQDDENRVLTFAELKELIETGNVDKIPNNKIIPERLNDAAPSESTATARKKPWEIANPTGNESES